MANNRVENTISFENCKLIYKNLSGRQSQYNPDGKREFNVIIDDEQIVEELQRDGWNVKAKVHDDGSEFFMLPVAVNYSFRPPKIWMISKNGKTLLDEDTVGQLDFADIISVDLVVRPYNWENNGRSGVKAYVQSMYVTIETDEFEAKYFGNDDDVPFD